MKTLHIKILALAVFYLVVVGAVSALPQQSYGTVAALSVNNEGTGYDGDGLGTSVVNVDWTGAMHIEVPAWVGVTTNYEDDFAFFGISWDRTIVPVDTTTGTTYAGDIDNGIIIGAVVGTVTLPTAVGNDGKEITVINNSSGAVAIATSGSETINGTTPPTLNAQYDTITVVSDGTNWLIMTSAITAGP